MPSVPRKKYPEMNWRAADKVATWKLFKRRMTVIFVADQVPEERQWALILVAGGDEAYNHWDTLEEKSKTVRWWIRYGTLSRRASNNQLHFGISETLIWQTSDRMNRRQQLTWISASSRPSGGANGRRKLRRSE